MSYAQLLWARKVTVKDATVTGSTLAAKAILIALASFSDVYGIAFAYNKTLVTEFETSESTVKRAIKILKNRQLITVLERYRDNGSQAHNGYIVNCPDNEAIPDDFDYSKALNAAMVRVNEKPNNTKLRKDKLTVITNDTEQAEGGVPLTPPENQASEAEGGVPLTSGGCPSDIGGVSEGHPLYLELDLDGYLESSNNNNNKPQNQKRIDPNLLACTFVDDTLAKSFLRQIANDSNADDLNHHLRALTSDKSFFSQLCASRKQYQLNALRWYVALNSIGDYLNTNGSLNTQTLFNHCLLNHKSDSNPFSYFVNVAKAQPITPVNKQAKSKKPTASDAFAPVPDYVVDHDELARIARDSDTRKGAN